MYSNPFTLNLMQFIENEIRKKRRDLHKIKTLLNVSEFIFYNPNAATGKMESVSFVIQQLEHCVLEWTILSSGVSFIIGQCFEMTGIRVSETTFNFIDHRKLSAWLMNVFRFDFNWSCMASKNLKSNLWWSRL